MTGRTRSRNWIAWGLLVVGLMLMAQNMGWVSAPWAWSVLLMAVGLAFVLSYFQDRRRWWALIPGAALLGLGSQEPAMSLFGERGGATFFMFLSAGFWSVFYLRRDHWWAVIPGGLFATLSVMAWLNFEGGSLLFTGLGLTFLLLYFLGRRWAVFPAAGLLLMAILSEEWVRLFLTWVWPLALMGTGVYLLWRGGQGRGTGTAH